MLTIDQAGTYFLQVTDPDNGCIFQDSVLVQSDQLPPDAQIAAAEELNCLNNLILLDGTGSTQGPAISYCWTDQNGTLLGQNSDLQVDSSGTYQLLVFNTQNGCADSTLISVAEDIEFPIVDVGPDTLINCGQSDVELTLVNNLPPGNYNYTWSDGMGNTLGDQQQVLVDGDGSYQLMVTNVDNGCAASDTLEVFADFNAPDADAGTDQVIDCITGAVDLNGSNSSAGMNISFIWLNENGVQVGTDPTVSVSEAGVYSLLVTDATNACSDTALVTVSLDDAVPLADAGANAVINCQTSMAVLDGTASSSGPAITYEWLDPSGTTAGTMDQLSVSDAGIYVLLVTDNTNGCSSESTVEVLLDTLSPPADPGLPQTINCLQDQVQIGGPGSASGPDIQYVWEDELGMFISDEAQPMVITSGMYFLTVINSGNGCSSTAEVSINLDTLAPLVDAGPDLLLNCLQPTGSIDGSNSSAGPEITYQWVDENALPISTDPQIPDPEAGIYVLEVTNSMNGCAASDTVLVEADFELPIVDAGPDLLLNCLTPIDSLLGDNSQTGPDFSLLWSDAGGMSVGTTVNLPVNLPGWYFLESTNVINGCSAIDSVLVEADFEAPSANAGTDLVLNCDNPAGTLNAASSSIGPEFTYTWLDPVDMVLGNDLLLNVDSGMMISLLVTNTINGCTASDMVVVSEDFEQPLADAGPDQLITCGIPEVLVDGSGSSSGPDFAYSWSNSFGEDLGTAPTWLTMEGGAFILEVLDLTNGCTALDTLEVQVDQEYPQAFLTAPEILTCVQLAVPLDANGTNGGSEFELIWESLTGGGITPGADPLVPTVTEPGSYQLVITNTLNECSDTATVEVLQDIAPPVAMAGADVHLNCFQESAALDAGLSSPVGSVSFSWSGTFPGDPNGASIQISEAGDLQPGGYKPAKWLYGYG